MRSRLCLLLVIAATGAGCAHPGRLQTSPGYQARAAVDRSLIKSSESILSEDAIQALLKYRVVVPAKAKLAVVCLDHLSASAGDFGLGLLPTSTEYLQRRKEFLDAIDKPLWDLGRFVEITHVPRLLLASNLSLVNLRVVAALMQADLLLAYQTSSELIYDSNFFSKDEVKSHGSMELVLMDVKTGAIPFAETFEETHLEKEQNADVDDFETRKRADHAVTLKVLQLGVEGLKRFFESLPQEG